MCHCSGYPLKSDVILRSEPDQNSYFLGYFFSDQKSRWCRCDKVNLKLNMIADKISYSLMPFVKFIYSEKATIFCEISTLLFSVCFSISTMWMRESHQFQKTKKVFFANWTSCKKFVYSETPKDLHLFLKSLFDPNN